MSLSPVKPIGKLSPVKPAWECVPTTAGGAVLSGGTGSAPSCAAGSAAALAPTYVASGVGGKPTVQFSGVNVQIVDGSGATGTVNGEGNLVVGYDESPGAQTGSHNLVLGEGQTDTGYGDVVGGFHSQATGHYQGLFGYYNQSSGAYTLAGGDQNIVTGTASSALGGYHNTASAPYSAVLGGCSNVAGKGTVSISSLCTNASSFPNDFTAIAGGAGNQTTGISATVTGGESNLSADPLASVSGGCDSVTGDAANPSTSCDTIGVESITGGWRNLATGQMSSVSGGQDNQARDEYATVAGGCANVSGGSGGLYCSTADGANPNVGSEAILGGQANYAGAFSTVTGFAASVDGGDINNAGGPGSAILGGYGNTVTGACASVPATPGSC